jgi:hypothetical protein
MRACVHACMRVCGMLVLRAGAGVCARRRSNFLLLRQEKVTKEKATLLCATPAPGRRGNLRCSTRRCTAELTARCALRSDNRGEPANEAGVSCGTPATAWSALLGTHRRGLRIKHPYGPSLRSAPDARAQAPCAARAGPSAAMARVDVLAVGLPRPFWMRQQGRLSFGYVSLAKQRKVPRPPGRLPASALSKSTPPATINERRTNHHRPK